MTVTETDLEALNFPNAPQMVSAEFPGPKSADALAGTASIKLGSMTSLTEAPASGVAVSPYGPAAVDPCTDNIARLFQGNAGPYGGANLKPFDATPEFTVNSSVTVTYAIQP